ncbi:MAG: ABC transporter permease [Firmicutes bacterium]|jgi:peptide/nickel transport system permease protein|nr:ABC transporter permease [Bacillota bacterium]
MDKFWRRFRRNKLALTGLCILVLFILSAIFAPLLAPHDPNRANLRNRNKPPSREHPFGTDDMGRDILSRLLYGGRISLSVGLVSVGISLTIGLILGAIAGYFGGAIDTVIMRLADIFYSFPFLILAITISAIFGPSIYNTMMILGILSWPGPARLLRAEFLKLKTTDFVAAATALGANPRRIMFRHILPNAFSPLLVSATLGVASAILSEAGLSFLGLGVPPPAPSWGNMLNRARPLHILAGMPWMWIPPGLAVFVVVLSINFVGDGLRDAFDPRQDQTQQYE